MSGVFGGLDFERLWELYSRGLTGVRWILGRDYVSARYFGRLGLYRQWRFARISRARWTPHGIAVVDGPAAIVALVDRGYGLKWVFGEVYVRKADESHLVGPWDVDYNPRTDRLAVADYGGRRVLELDRYGRLVRVLDLSSTELGGPVYPVSVSYVWWADAVLVADPVHHVVVEVGWDGEIRNVIGEYGSPGSTLGTNPRLNHPYSASPMSGEKTYLIADRDNNRVLIIDQKYGHYRVIAYPEPMWAEVPLGGGYEGMYAIAGDGEFPVVLNNDGIQWYSTLHAENLCHVTPDWTVLTVVHGSLIELDLRAPAPLGVLPQAKRYWAGKSLAANTPARQPFLVPPVYRRVAVYVKASASGTLRILVPKIGGDATAREVAIMGPPDSDFEWEVYDEVSLSADTLAKYIPTAPSFLMAAEVELSSDGTVDLWVTWS